MSRKCAIKTFWRFVVSCWIWVLGFGLSVSWGQVSSVRQLPPRLVSEPINLFDATNRPAGAGAFAARGSLWRIPAVQGPRVFNNPPPPVFPASQYSNIPQPSVTNPLAIVTAFVRLKEENDKTFRAVLLDLKNAERDFGLWFEPQLTHGHYLVEWLSPSESQISLKDLNTGERLIQKAEPSGDLANPFPSLAFENAKAIDLLKVYSRLSGKVIVPAPSTRLTGTLSVRSSSALDRPGGLSFIRTILRDIGIVLVERGDSFVFAVSPFETNGIPEWNQNAINASISRSISGRQALLPATNRSFWVSGRDFRRLYADNSGREDKTEKRNAFYNRKGVSTDVLTPIGNSPLLQTERIYLLESMAYLNSCSIERAAEGEFSFYSSPRFLENAMSLRTALLSRYDTNLIESLKELTLFYNSMTDATNVYRVGQDYLERLTHVYGVHHREVIFSIEGQVTRLRSLGRKSDAIDLYKRLIRDHGISIEKKTEEKWVFENTMGRFITLLSEEHRSAEFQTLCDELFPGGAEAVMDPLFRSARAWLRIAEQQWDAAIADLTVLNKDPKCTWNWRIHLALALRARGNLTAYEQQRDLMLSAVASNEVARPLIVAMTAMLGPLSQSNIPLVRDLMVLGIAQEPGRPRAAASDTREPVVLSIADVRKATDILVRNPAALLNYRAGLYEEALDAVQGPPDQSKGPRVVTEIAKQAVNHFIAGMAHARLKHANSARFEFQAGQETLAKAGSNAMNSARTSIGSASPDWVELMFASILEKELSEMLYPLPPPPPLPTR